MPMIRSRREKYLALPEIKSRVLGRPARNQFTI
jgi:hypothetical protein